MRFTLPRPIHGWRAFLGEVGIIVLGVLLALAGEQAISSWRERREVADFRTAVDKEIGTNLFNLRFRASQSDCVKRRLTELERWLDAWERGQRPVLTNRISRPFYLLPLRSVWDSSTQEVMANMALDDRLAIANVYSIVDTAHDNIFDERRIWNDIQDYSHARSLTDEQAMKLGGLIDRARQYDRIMALNLSELSHYIGKLGVKPNREFVPGEVENDLCVPLKWSGQG